MNVEFFREISEDSNPEIITIDINEDAPIKDLFSKLHDITDVPRYTELEWDGKIEKIACTYYYYTNESEFFAFQSIENLDKIISEFPKNGRNGELGIYIDTNAGLIN